MQLALERRRAAQAAEELRRTKEQNVVVQKQCEQEEEFITNRLLHRLHEVQRDRAVLAQEIEAEEDFLVNTLQRRLAQLQRDKADVEARLAQEQEGATGLSRRLAELAEERRRLLQDKANLENSLEAEQEYITHKLTKQVDKLGSEKAALVREKGELQRHVGDLAAAVTRTRHEKVQLEAALEAEEEAAVNKLQRQLQQVTTAYRVLEARMEAAGLSPRCDGAPFIDSTVDWVYGRSPSRTSMDRLMGSRRERSLSVSSSSSMRDPSFESGHPSHTLHPINPGQQQQHHWNAPMQHGGASAGAPMPLGYASSTSSPDHRRRMAALVAQATPAPSNPMSTQSM